MKAGDIMTTKVLAVDPDTPGRSIAHLLFKSGISAVPVVDEHGAPIGMVSEGDLVPRDESEREARRDWWLKVLAEGEELSPEFLQQLEPKDRTARQIMSAPVVTVEEGADIVEIAELLSARKIKRVPVVRDGRIVGIVSRADLIKAVARSSQVPDPEPSPDRDAEILVPSERLAALTRREPARAATRQAPADGAFSARTFQGLVAHFSEEDAARREQARRHTVEQHQQEARQLLSARLSDEAWQRMLNEARLAAQRGEVEHLLLRFPGDLCSDHGRAVNAPDPNWPATLRGIAAQVFMRWKNELRPQGFGLRARVLEFPDGLPGDIGLFLAWG